MLLLKVAQLFLHIVFYCKNIYLGSIYNRCANLENDMISMERCIKYMQIVQEAPSHILEVDNNLIKENWPQYGEIQFQNFSFKYRPDTEIVLKKINFTIKSGEKIGIYGRTGSGKSAICFVFSAFWSH